MKKQILSIGKVLSKVEQKQVFGGNMDDGGDEGLCYGNSDTCRTDTNKKCCSGKCTTKNDRKFGVCFGA